MKALKIKILEITSDLKKKREDLQKEIASLIETQKLYEEDLKVDAFQVLSEDETEAIGIVDINGNDLEFSDDIECVVVDTKIYINA